MRIGFYTTAVKQMTCNFKTDVIGQSFTYYIGKGPDDEINGPRLYKELKNPRRACFNLTRLL